MKILTKKSFAKNYLKLRKKDQLDVIASLEEFGKSPFDSKLRNHALKGKFLGARSIDANFDTRIIFVELSGGRYELVSLVRVGSHSELYGE